MAQCRHQTLRKGHALQERLLYRQLLTAVSPWVGKVTLPPTPQRPALHTRGVALLGRTPSLWPFFIQQLLGTPWDWEVFGIHVAHEPYSHS